MGGRGLRAKGSGTALWTWSRRRYSLTLHRSPSGVQNKWRLVNQLVLLEHKYRALTQRILRMVGSTLWGHQNVNRFGYSDFLIPIPYRDFFKIRIYGTINFLCRYWDPQKWQKPRNRDVTWQAGKRLHQYIEKGQTSDNPLKVFDLAKVCLLNTII